MQQPLVHTSDSRVNDHPTHPSLWLPEAPIRMVRFALPLIVLLLTGCDNLSWGGAEFAVVPPPPGAVSHPDIEDDVDLPSIAVPPTGPVLYYVRATEGEALLVPVAEIVTDGLRPIEVGEDWERFGQQYIAQSLRQGTEFALFHNGERVGTYVLQSATIPDDEVCPRTPRATGILELVTAAHEVTEFLAIPKTHAPPGGRRPVATNLVPDARVPRQATILAERALRARRARLPNDWMRAMTELQPFSIVGSADPAFASTFVLGDSVSRGPNPAGHSLFFIAQPRPQVGYDTTYVVFTDFATSGRATPRVIDALDWTRTGKTGLLLEVSSGHDSWFEAVELSDGSWRHILSTRCEIRPEPLPGAADDTSGSSEP